ncbi:hypothetical protein [Ruegeria sp. HKCCA0370]|uniref:hypothetical protein n=1 Tax=Ruegeria sp. HKCCA0370 TaxID=2682995 RepID=UPI001488C13B|nr:hypothetical protein [Ruegeria sp. HKCCA0370]
MTWVTFGEGTRRLKSQEALDDASSAIYKWAYGPIQPGGESRVMYISAVTLLRVFGHVLHKVDCNKFPEIGAEVERRFQRWKKGEGRDLIFAEFIEKERNLILKEYAPNWSPDNEVELKWRTLPAGPYASEESKQFSAALFKGLEGRTMKAILMPTGPFAGWSFDELLSEAASWWMQQLFEIELLLEDA